ncbi:DUF1508 domain-containing protein [Candidatus Parcubacteria bacterium]|nr:DUF1508 domain-containing protein [Candidatus Parcubacteria bacterium]
MRTPKFQIYQDRALQWRWRLVAGNGEIVAVGESYPLRPQAVRSAQRVKEIAALAVIE